MQDDATNKQSPVMIIIGILLIGALILAIALLTAKNYGSPTPTDSALNITASPSPSPSSTSTTTTPIPSASTSQSSDVEIDQELKALDDSINQTNPADFDTSELSDENVGL